MGMGILSVNQSEIIPVYWYLCLNKNKWGKNYKGDLNNSNNSNHKKTINQVHGSLEIMTIS